MKGSRRSPQILHQRKSAGNLICEISEKQNSANEKT
ncbi:hypothetical protein AT05_02435 [Schleiferia thermophila str. Yellowstone]|jgi:hypothetical protein|uniref:Uncharacterized protein n=1 Tax=Schleiferia thermophila TaxID=884107 RepID=A0A369A984_9FLAO|nr:hypothetical protein AT05_02435 [Schleiferia thermophila str. Yellowstone]RCX05705.1 hypothetical protein DES35_101993 [Schleiferia thermophila]